MSNFFYKKTNNTIDISITTQGISRTASVILIILVIVSFLLPIFFLIVGLSFGVPIRITFFITLAIFWGTSFFFLRKYLWGKFGEEIYILKPISLEYKYSYKLYSDKFEEIFQPSLFNMGLIDENDKMIYLKDCDLIDNFPEKYKIFFETKVKLVKSVQFVEFDKQILTGYVNFIDNEIQSI